MREMNNEMELNMDELKQVNGGIGICFEEGYTNIPPDVCSIFGVAHADNI